jgi:RecB family exonuclease
MIGPPADPRLIAALRARGPFSASALERWVACPVMWFVERGLGAEDLEPNPIPRARGSAAHDALHVVLRGVRERTGSARIDARTLPLALELLAAAVQEHPLDRIEGRRLHDDLRRYLRFLAEAEPSAYEPRELELSFGLDEDAMPAVELAGGALELCGRIDRVDVDAVTGSAVVYDYKASGSVDAAASWRQNGRLQPALYMLAVERLLGADPVAGLYQPLRARDLRPRGAVRADSDAGVALVDNDRLEPDQFRELIEDRLSAAVAAARELAAGALEPRPRTCGPNGRCRYPAICRCEAR